jgi:endonuclease/exonuclease/phosphatase family metal-dependent hydrolase
MHINIGTFNIQSGMDRKYYLSTKVGRQDFNLTVNAIRNLKLDICGLNEVPNSELLGGGVNAPKLIGEALGYHYAFAKAIVRSDGVTEYGNALVSRYPILSTKCVLIHLPEEQRIAGRRAYEDRVILCAEILVDAKIITVMCAHFGLYDDEIALAVETLRKCVEECKTPLLVMGDFNLTPDSEYYKPLCTFLTDTVTDPSQAYDTFPSEAPIKRIDYIFKNEGIKFLTASVPEVIASDHRPFTVIADI